MLIVELQISESPPALAEERKTFVVPFHTVNGLILLDAGERQAGRATARHWREQFRRGLPLAGFDALKLDALRSTGSAGAEGACAVREVKLSLEHRSWLNRRVCAMDLSDASRRMGVRVDEFIGANVLDEFAAMRIDYKNHTLELEQ